MYEWFAYFKNLKLIEITQETFSEIPKKKKKTGEERALEQINQVNNPLVFLLRLDPCQVPCSVHYILHTNKKKILSHLFFFCKSQLSLFDDRSKFVSPTQKKIILDIHNSLTFIRLLRTIFIYLFFFFWHMWETTFYI